MLALWAFIFERPWPALSPPNLGGFAYLGLVNTGLGYALWFRGIKRLKASALPPPQRHWAWLPSPARGQHHGDQNQRQRNDQS